MYPPDVVRLKRDLDRTAHTSAPLFDEQFLDRYAALIDLCFVTFGGWGADAQLRTFPDRREEAAGDDWNSDWDACFADRSAVAEMGDVAQAYKELMAYLAGAIGVAEVDAHLLGTTTIPANVARPA